MDFLSVAQSLVSIDLEGIDDERLPNFISFINIHYCLVVVYVSVHANKTIAFLIDYDDGSF